MRHGLESRERGFESHRFHSYSEASMIPDYLKEYVDHPNRVKLEDLKPGDFFVCIHNDRRPFDEYNRHMGFERVWRVSGAPKIGEYSSSLFALNVSMANHVVGLQTTCIYLWFGKDPIIIKLPKKQQTIYRKFFNSIEKNDDVHKLGWSDWRRSHPQR